jgi:hypothetical protein
MARICFALIELAANHRRFTGHAGEVAFKQDSKAANENERSFGKGASA